ncbi:MAG: mfs multidrug transporter [Lasallia pustulata]|uniref:Mfs multidrug transporter n=1 Tax=Lasallia pustulata TaxID=136370 RepID=A0A5M8Q246_9LECA|nr:MAG: mfs multidrug transporter [Lasallia pustulata]
MASSNPGRYSDTRATETSPLLRRRESSKQAVGSGGDEVLKSDLLDVDVVAGARQNVGSCGENDKNISLSNINPRRRLMWAMPSLVLGVFLSAADQTIVVSTYGKIGSELQALSTSSWIATGYFLTLTSFQPLYGRLSEIFGRKPAFLFSFAVFGLGCLFCGLARTMRELIAARAFAGIGGGGMTTVVAILLSDVIPLRDRGTWQGYFNIVFAAGAGLGGPLGGVLADHIGWRWCFLIQVPLTIAALINVHYALESPAEDLSNLKRKLQRIDFAVMSRGIRRYLMVH